MIDLAAAQLRDNFQDLIAMEDHRLQDTEVEGTSVIVLDLCKVEEVVEEVQDIIEVVVAGTMKDMTIDMLEEEEKEEEDLLLLTEWTDRMIEVVKDLIHLNLRKAIEERLEVKVDLLLTRVTHPEEKEEMVIMEVK